MSQQAEEWPDDVPGVAEPPPDDVDAEIEALRALYDEQRRTRGLEAPAPKPSTWEPRDALSAALWRALPDDGRGVEYTRLVRAMAADQWPLHHVRVALLGLVLIGKAYVEPGYQGCSMAGRGTDPRVGVHAYRTGHAVRCARVARSGDPRQVDGRSVLESSRALQRDQRRQGPAGLGEPTP